MGSVWQRTISDISLTNRTKAVSSLPKLLLLGMLSYFYIPSTRSGSLSVPHVLLILSPGRAGG